jgi:hypothetical protein
VQYPCTCGYEQVEVVGATLSSDRPQAPYLGCNPAIQGRLADPRLVSKSCPNDPNKSKITLAMEDSLAAAEDYLDYSAFSRQGLIDQLSSEYGSGFKVQDAAWAAGQLDVDWKQQAVRAAKEYLDYSPFSRQGLIDQLSSPYGAQFTLEEAIYAVNKLGL